MGEGRGCCLPIPLKSGRDRGGAQRDSRQWDRGIVVFTADQPEMAVRTSVARSRAPPDFRIAVSTALRASLSE